MVSLSGICNTAAKIFGDLITCTVSSVVHATSFVVGTILDGVYQALFYPIRLVISMGNAVYTGLTDPKRLYRQMGCLPGIRRRFVRIVRNVIMMGVVMSYVPALIIAIDVPWIPLMGFQILIGPMSSVGPATEVFVRAFQML